MGLDDGNLAGWHRDPSGRHELRFWDGDAWTEHVVDEGIPGLDYPTRSGRPPEGAKPTPVPTIEPPVVPATADEAVQSQAAEPRPVAPAPTTAAADPPEPDADPAVAAREEDPPVVTPAPATVDLVAESELDERTEAATEHGDTEDTAGQTVEETDGDREAPESTEPAVIQSPLVGSASVLAPGREADAGTEPGRVRPASPATGRSRRSGRRGDPPVPPIPPAPEREPVADASTADVHPEHAPVPTADTTPAERESPVTPAVGMPLRLIAEAPTVASPAGNSAGSNTSAIADPHRHAGATPTPAVPDATGPRVTGTSPVPVKRYRPGSPPASPLAGPRALATPVTDVVGTVVRPWYRRPSAWFTIVAVGVVAALVVVIVGLVTDGNTDRIGGRPPAAAPEGHKVIDGDGFGIAAPAGWIVATDPGNAFTQLRRTNWATPLAATDAKSGGAVLVVQLRHLAHQPQVDPELFWTDQVKNAGQGDTVSPGPPLSIHGFRANEITVSGPPGTPLVAASVDTGDRTFLVAVTAATTADAQTEFDRLIQTFDAR